MECSGLFQHLRRKSRRPTDARQPSGTNTTDTILSTIEEAKVITTVLPAEYGHSAGGAIVIVKKSGTNQLHGGGGTLFREGPMQHRRFMQPARFEQLLPSKTLICQLARPGSVGSSTP